MKIRAMVFLDGLIAGIIGAAIIAIWFLFLDAVIRLPFYTPTVLGEGLFLRAQDLALTDGLDTLWHSYVVITACASLPHRKKNQSNRQQDLSETALVRRWRGLIVEA